MTHSWRLTPTLARQTASRSPRASTALTTFPRPRDPLSRVRRIYRLRTPQSPQSRRFRRASRRHAIQSPVSQPSICHSCPTLGFPTSVAGTMTAMRAANPRPLGQRALREAIPLPRSQPPRRMRSPRRPLSQARTPNQRGIRNLPAHRTLTLRRNQLPHPLRRMGPIETTALGKRPVIRKPKCLRPLPLPPSPRQPIRQSKMPLDLRSKGIPSFSGPA